MLLTRTTAPTETPISTADLKSHLRISHTAEDTLLGNIVNAVAEEIDGPDGYLRRAVVTQQWGVSFRYWHDFFSQCPRRWGMVVLPPLQSVGSITYYDADNNQQTLATSNYSVLTPDGAAGRIELTPGATLPQVYARADAITIAITAGYGAATEVPQRIKQACLILGAELYRNRGDQDPGRGFDPGLVDRMLGPYRWRQFA